MKRERQKRKVFLKEILVLASHPIWSPLTNERQEHEAVELQGDGVAANVDLDRHSAVVFERGERSKLTTPLNWVSVQQTGCALQVGFALCTKPSGQGWTGPAAGDARALTH